MNYFENIGEGMCVWGVCVWCVCVIVYVSVREQTLQQLFCFIIGQGHNPFTNQSFKLVLINLIYMSCIIYFIIFSFTKYTKMSVCHCGSMTLWQYLEDNIYKVKFNQAKTFRKKILALVTFQRLNELIIKTKYWLTN